MTHLLCWYYQAKYGHAQVPIGFEENVQLANWTSTQRQEYKNLLKGKSSRLNEERIRLLNDVGFAWELQRGGRKRLVTGGDAGDSGPGGSPSKSSGSAVVLPGVALLGGDNNHHHHHRHQSHHHQPEPSKKLAPPVSAASSSATTRVVSGQSNTGSNPSSRRSSETAPAPPAVPPSQGFASLDPAVPPSQGFASLDRLVSLTAQPPAPVSNLSSLDPAMLQYLLMHNNNATIDAIIRGALGGGQVRAAVANQLMGASSGLTTTSTIEQALLFLRATQATSANSIPTPSNNYDHQRAAAPQNLPLSVLQSMLTSPPTANSMHSLQRAGQTTAAGFPAALWQHATSTLLQQQLQQLHAHNPYSSAGAPLPAQPVTSQTFAEANANALTNAMQQQQQQQSQQGRQENNNSLQDPSSEQPFKRSRHT